MSSSSSAPEGLWRLPLALVLGCLLLAYSAVLGIRGWLDAPLNLREAVVMEIPEGGNLTRFVSSLHDRGVLMHPVVLRLQARLDGVANRVRAGEYQLDPGLTARQLLAKLISGEVVQYAITVVEGTTTAAMLDLLRLQPKLQETLLPGASSSLPVQPRSSARAPRQCRPTSSQPVPSHRSSASRARYRWGYRRPSPGR